MNPFKRPQQRRLSIPADLLTPDFVARQVQTVLQGAEKHSPHWQRLTSLNILIVTMAQVLGLNDEQIKAAMSEVFDVLKKHKENAKNERIPTPE